MEHGPASRVSAPHFVRPFSHCGLSRAGLVGVARPACFFIGSIGTILTNVGAALPIAVSVPARLVVRPLVTDGDPSPAERRPDPSNRPASILAYFFSKSTDPHHRCRNNGFATTLFISPLCVGWPLMRRSWRMDLEIAHLVEATQRIADGEVRILRQQALVEELRAQGHTAENRESERLLALFRMTLAEWNAYRDLIEEAIAKLDQASPTVGVSSSISSSAK